MTVAKAPNYKGIRLIQIIYLQGVEINFNLR